MKKIVCSVCRDYFEYNGFKTICSEECEEKEKKRISEYKEILSKIDEKETQARIERQNIRKGKLLLRARKRLEKKRKKLLAKEKVRKEKQAFKINNPQKHKEHALERRAKKQNKPINGFYETREWQELRYRVLRKFGRACMCCGSSNCELHVDHIKPRSKHPELELEFTNLQILCRACNLGKSNTDETDWRPKPKESLNAPN